MWIITLTAFALVLLFAATYYDFLDIIIDVNLDTNHYSFYIGLGSRITSKHRK